MLFSTADAVSFFFGAVLCLVNFHTEHFMLNNLLGVALSVIAISNVSIGSYKIAVTLLIGMFVYDVFWVYGTDVMVTVAKTIQIPAKLLFCKVAVAQPSLLVKTKLFFLT